MTISKDQINLLRSLGFKFRNSRRYSYLTSYNQFFTVNVLKNGFQIEIDGVKFHGQELSFDNLLTILLILLYPDEKR